MYTLTYQEAVEIFLNDHPEFFESDIEYSPDVYREFCAETGFSK